MKKVLLLTTLLVAGLALVSTAYAFPVKFETISYFAWGRLYDAAGNPLNQNPYDLNNGSALTPGSYTGGDGLEDAFGITKVLAITSLDGLTTYWSQASTGEELTVFFWDADDVALYPAGPTDFQLYSDGFLAEAWLDSTPDYNPNLGTGGRNNPIDPSHYQNVTDDGTMVLSLAGHTQWLDYLIGGTTMPYTLKETGDPVTGAFGGNILLDVTGGAWSILYDTNTQGPGLSGTNADFLFTFTTLPNPGVADWVVLDVSTAYGDMIPEPASMMLLGIGLLGLATLRRKKVA